MSLWVLPHQNKPQQFDERWFGALDFSWDANSAWVQVTPCGVLESLGIASAGDFDQPEISNAGAVGVWEPRDLELWSFLDMPNQQRYKSHSVGLWGAWGLPGQSPRCTQQSLYTQCLAVVFLLFGVLASSKSHPNIQPENFFPSSGRLLILPRFPCTLALLLFLSSLLVCLLQPNHSRL